MPATAHRVVIVGGGFGGLSAAITLKGAGADITLVDRRNHHLFQPLLYQVATAALAPSEIAWPIRTLMRKRGDVRTLLGTVTEVDKAARDVVLEDGSRLPYDSLIIAAGGRHAYFGKDEWEEYAPGLKTLEDATLIRRRVLLAFEAAEREPDPARRQALTTFVIIGGGPTGVEMAGAVHELAQIAVRGEFRALDPSQARVVLIEGAEKLLLGFDDDLSAYAKVALERLGVTVELGNNVTAVDDDGVEFGGRRIEAETIVWAAGVEAAPVGKWLDVETDKAGRAKVMPDLSIKGHGEIFVVGDASTIEGPDGKPVPGIGDAAKQAGRHAANVVRARIAGTPPPGPFRYKHLGSLATIGKRAAVIDLGWIKLKGRLAWWVWGLAHIYFLIDTRNRFLVGMTWLWIYLTGRRGARLITQGEAQTIKPLEEIDDPAETAEKV